jgi:hypothetical protein
MKFKESVRCITSRRSRTSFDVSPDGDQASFIFSFTASCSAAGKCGCYVVALFAFEKP